MKHVQHKPSHPNSIGYQIGKFLLHLFLLAFPLFLTELLCYFLMRPTELWSLAFGGLWAVLLAAIVLLLPRLLGRILWGLVFYAAFIWSMMQAGYYQVFGKLNGKAILDDGTVLEIRDLLGSAEKVENKW